MCRDSPVSEVLSPVSPFRKDPKRLKKVKIFFFFFFLVKLKASNGLMNLCLA